jgi:transcriptional repressor NrdR
MWSEDHGRRDYNPGLCFSPEFNTDAYRVEAIRRTVSFQRSLLQSLLPRSVAKRMKCPFCGFENDKVVDSRESKEADSIRRRRECLKCEKRFTTYERIDEIPYMVVKKDGRRERFDRQKVLNGLMRACEKRPVPISRLEQIVNEAETFVIESAERERKTSEIGELIMNRLRRHDKVAYVRFASVYLDFKDVQEFMAELKDLLKAKDAPEPKGKTAKT